MKYIWEEKDIEPGVRFKMANSISDYCIVKTVGSFNHYAVLADNVVDYEMSKVDLAQWLNMYQAVPTTLVQTVNIRSTR